MFHLIDESDHDEDENAPLKKRMIEVDERLVEEDPGGEP